MRPFLLRTKRPDTGRSRCPPVRGRAERSGKSVWQVKYGILIPSAARCWRTGFRSAAATTSAFTPSFPGRGNRPPTARRSAGTRATPRPTRGNGGCACWRSGTTSLTPSCFSARAATSPGRFIPSFTRSGGAANRWRKPTGAARSAARPSGFTTCSPQAAALRCTT